MIDLCNAIAPPTMPCAMKSNRCTKPFPSTKQKQKKLKGRMALNMKLVAWRLTQRREKWLAFQNVFFSIGNIRFVLQGALDNIIATFLLWQSSMQGSLLWKSWTCLGLQSKCLNHKRASQNLFFSDRIVWKHGAHFKGFAGDTLACVTVLGLYIDDYLDGKGILEDQVDAFKSLRRVLDLLKLGDKAVPRLRELRDEFKKYHALILVLDGFHATVKTHYMRKIPDCIDLLKRLLSCWAPERKHRAGKMIAGHTYKGLTKSLLAHDLHNMKIEFSKPEAFQPIMLDCDNKLDGLQLFGSREVYGSRRVKTPIGTFAEKKMKLWFGWKGALASTVRRSVPSSRHPF